VRIIAAYMVLSSFVTGAMAENLVMDHPSIHYGYNYETLGSRHFCDFATLAAKASIMVKLTAIFSTDDEKVTDQDLSVSYYVEAFLIHADKNSQLVPQQVKVVAARIISDVFNTDLHASKNVDTGLGASYSITSEEALHQFTNVITLRGEYVLYVEFPTHDNLTINVQPTADILGPSQKWTKCSVAIVCARSNSDPNCAQHRLPP
jgi:hypothetical protein